MLKEKVLNALNKQINAEMHSAYLYLSMSAYLQDKGLAGFANWMKVQYKEELSHALKIFDYVNERNGRVVLEPIAGVPIEFDGIIDVFEKTLEHEQKVTQMIDQLMDVAVADSDHATQSFLQWFVDEQVEEEANVNELLDNLRLIDGQGNGVFMLNRELQSRTFVDATQAE
ncbi:ferritin [uncultured Sunxiuqinia sp.]|jgi:ferritin|uniref:ferritin n=1 Tax=uncultured Sunxiuqinia sp. TaxID=1573825 RepID=UPI0019B41475|nr:ferritin [Sunxiuqinia sp.]|tara:strand:- start:56990 stop:57502 length:513 start_codon:yes stop_codon:yes gene_type:complete